MRAVTNGHLQFMHELSLDGFLDDFPKLMSCAYGFMACKGQPGIRDFKKNEMDIDQDT